MTRGRSGGIAVVLLVALVCVLTAPVGARDVKIGKAEDYDPVISPADFQDAGGDLLPIDNPWWPMTPGTTYVYEDTEGEEHNEVYVTHETKEILGVTCTVVRDRVWVEGELVEETLDWYAQDKDGNVWYFGEDSKEFVDGQVIPLGSWEAGVDGAKPGILMLASPRSGDSYRQEFLEDEAEDMGKVLRLAGHASVPYGSFYSCLVVKEWTPLDRGTVEFKYYAPGVGLVLVVEGSGGPSTRIELIEVN